MDAKTSGSASSPGGIRCFRTTQKAGRTILLISNDRRFHERFRAFANTFGLLVIRAERTAGTVTILQATHPAMVLLDLDLPDEAAWEMAELLLNEPACPGVILLTGRAAQFDTRAAARTGSLISKNDPLSHVLEIVAEGLDMAEVNQSERNSIQRVLIRWLRPSVWAKATSPAYRFWGINE